MKQGNMSVYDCPDSSDPSAFHFKICSITVHICCCCQHILLCLPFLTIFIHQYLHLFSLWHLCLIDAKRSEEGANGLNSVRYFLLGDHSRFTSVSIKAMQKCSSAHNHVYPRAMSALIQPFLSWVWPAKMILNTRVTLCCHYSKLYNIHVSSCIFSGYHRTSLGIPCEEVSDGIFVWPCICPRYLWTTSCA